RDADWKSATVIAGSLIEALLLWALLQKPTADVQKAARDLAKAKTIRPTDPTLEKWDGDQYIEVAAELKIIKSKTVDQVRIVKWYRNLIHPGRAKRLAEKCDRGTAHAAIAGLEFVIRDLQP